MTKDSLLLSWWDGCFAGMVKRGEVHPSGTHLEWCETELKALLSVRLGMPARDYAVLAADILHKWHQCSCYCRPGGNDSDVNALPRCPYSLGCQVDVTPSEPEEDIVFSVPWTESDVLKHIQDILQTMKDSLKLDEQANAATQAWIDAIDRRLEKLKAREAAG